VRPNHHVPVVRSRGGRGEHRMDPRAVEGDGTVRFGRRLRELPRGGTRGGSGTGSGRIRPGEVRAARRPQTEVRSAELVPDEPEHSAVTPTHDGSSYFRRIRWLSPNSCHRYPFAIASRYASMTRGNPINAASIARWLVTGSWKPVNNPSTDRTGFPGWTKRRVNPCRGRAPSGVQAD